MTTWLSLGRRVALALAVGLGGWLILDFVTRYVSLGAICFALIAVRLILWEDLVRLTRRFANRSVKPS